jgi:hypothetical protein
MSSELVLIIILLSPVIGDYETKKQISDTKDARPGWACLSQQSMGKMYFIISKVHHFSIIFIVYYG